MMPWAEDADMIERQDAAERIDAPDAAEPTESTDQADPTEPIEPIEPTEPIDRIEPSLAMQRMELRDRSDQRERDGSAWACAWACELRRHRLGTERAYTRRHGGGMARGQP